MCRLKNHKRVDLLIEATRRIIDITGNTNIKVIIGTGPEKEIDKSFKAFKSRR